MSNVQRSKQLTSVASRARWSRPRTMTNGTEEILSRGSCAVAGRHDFRYRQTPSRRQHSERFAKHRGLVRDQVVHAVRHKVLGPLKRSGRPLILQRANRDLAFLKFHVETASVVGPERADRSIVNQDREDLTRRQAHHVDFELGTPILTGRRRDLEFHLANDGATLPVEESCVLLGVAELIDAGPESPATTVSPWRPRISTMCASDTLPSVIAEGLSFAPVRIGTARLPAIKSPQRAIIRRAGVALQNGQDAALEEVAGPAQLSSSEARR